MQSLQRSFLIATFILLAGCEYIPFSGGEINGVVTPVPADWSNVAQASIVRLETNPQDPYSVKLWVIGLEDALYVHAGANRATWVENIEADANVRMLIGKSIYELRAVREQDANVFKRFSDAYEIKYGSRPRNENIAEVYLYRLEARH